MKRTKLQSRLAIIKEEKKICDRKRVYNLSGTDIPKETEELIGRLGFNFQFTERKFPSLEIITAAELCAQRIESQQPSPNNGDCQRIIIQNKERDQCIRNIMVAHIQKYHDMHIRPNITKAEWDRLKTFRPQQELIKLPADKGSAIVIEKDQKYIKKEQDQIGDMDVVPCTCSESATLCHVRSRIIEEFKLMGLKEKEYIYRYFLVTAAEIAKIYLPIKTHKPHDDFPGRPVVNQTCDHTNCAKSFRKSFIHLLSERSLI